MILAIYGKGGIGKSTIAAHISATMARQGATVLQVGCDPKGDSTFTLTGRFVKTVTEVLASKGFDPSAIEPEEVVFSGRYGSRVVEVGGPLPGEGCGGFVVGETIELLRKLNLFEPYDYIIFDVLGDIVCGGFAVPMNFAHKVYLVVTDDFDSLFAANRINAAITLKAQHYPVRLAGVVANKCEGLALTTDSAQLSAKNEPSVVERFCQLSLSPLVATVPLSSLIAEGRRRGKTILEMPQSEDLQERFKAIVEHIRSTPEGPQPEILSSAQLFDLFSLPGPPGPEERQLLWSP